MKLSWWTQRLKNRKREIAHKRYWGYKEAYISLLLLTSFLLIIIPTLYFLPADAAGKNITLYKQMSTHLACLTTLHGLWSMFCCPLSIECVVGRGTWLLFFFLFLYSLDCYKYSLQDQSLSIIQTIYNGQIKSEKHVSYIFW